MARTALGRLQEAKELDKLADGLRKRDPPNARKIQEQANRLRSSAVRQLGRKPRRSGTKGPSVAAQVIKVT